METTTAQPMTVRNLIDILNGVENKSLPVYVYVSEVVEHYRTPIQRVDTMSDCVDIDI